MIRFLRRVFAKPQYIDTHTGKRVSPVIARLFPDQVTKL